MDLPVNELQKMFGKMPINHHSRAIVFENKKTRNILIIAGLVLLVGGTAFYSYNKGKKRSEEERARLQKKINEMEAKNENQLLPSSQAKKAITNDPIVGLKNLGGLQAKKLTPELLTSTRYPKFSATENYPLKRKDETIFDKKPIAVNEDEFKA